MPELLRGRTAGIPNLALAAGLAVALWFFFLRGRSPSPSTSQAGAASTANPSTAGYSLGYAQGLQAAGVQQASQGSIPSATSSNGCPPDTAFNLADWRLYGGTWEYAPGGRYGTWVKNCVAYSHIDSEGSVQQILSQGGKVYFFPTPGNPVPGNLGSVWQGTPLTGGIPGVPAGVGGASGGAPKRKQHIGSRSAHEWQDAHPLVGERVLYPHYVRAVGGPRNHAREVRRVATQAGVHAARIQMLNPEHTGRIRVA